MNEQELRQQIDMFFKGELSDTEEQGLRDYLATHEVPEDFIQEKRIILSLIPDRSVHIPDHLEEKLSSYIDRLPDKKRQVLFSRNWKWISGIAAGIILAISTGLYVYRQPSSKRLSDQEIYACAEAQRALILVSQKLNKGTNQWQQAQKESLSKSSFLKLFKHVAKHILIQTSKIQIIMKQTIYILLLAVFGILSATAENNFIEKFANQKGVTYVNISKALLNMMPEGQIDAEGLNLKAVINELDRIQILTCEDNEALIPQMRKESIVFQKAPYEELMKVKDDGETVAFYVQPKTDKKIKELIMLVDDGDCGEFTVIRLLGDISITHLQELTKDAGL